MHRKEKKRMTVEHARQCPAAVEVKASELEILNQCISELERQKKARKYIDVRCKDNIPLQNRLVKLIGNKPLFDCLLSGVSSRVLWDTGSMISLVSHDWVKENCPEADIRPIAEIIEESGQSNEIDPSSLSFTAANNLKVPMLGCVVLKYELGSCSFEVPFLVTTSKLSNPIIGYNVIVHMVKSGKQQEVCDMLIKSICDVDANKIEVMVNLLTKDIDDDDFLADLKAMKPCVIPKKSSVTIKCKVKGSMVKGLDLPFVCSEPLLASWDEDLVVTESLGELVRGRTPHVNIEIRNTSGKDKFIRKNMIVGEISAVSAVLPIKLFNSNPFSDDKTVLNVDGTTSNDVEHEPDVTSHDVKWQPKADLTHLPERERKEVEQLLYEECEVFAKDDCDIGEIPDLQMDIHLTDEVPINQAYRHLPRKLYEDVKNYLNDLIVNGWIQESTSPYASPIVCVRKKDGSLRLCVDYRRLNLKTVPDRQPIPRVQDLLDGLHGQKLFTTLDMAKAYHQGYVRDICRKYTAFSTPWALFEWLRIPFGLKNAPAAFQRYISTALSGLVDKVCLAYLDDILIYGKTFEEHKANLRSVLQRLKSKGVKLRVDKCEFFKTEVRYLGRLVSENGYRADPKDVKALDKFREPPTTAGEVRSLVGFLGYYRNYVRDFAKKLKPVYDLLKTEVKPGAGDVKTKYNKRRAIVWTPDLQSRVDGVIDTLQSPAVMAFPDFESPFILNTDASGYGLGAVLYQKQGEEKLNRVISYASRTLTDAERNYHLHSGKLEFLALKWGVTEKFSDYLGHGAKFTVFTDNNPLTYVMTSAKLNATGMRWVSDLADYDFDLRYRPGKNNADADGLSRNPIDVGSSTIEDLEKNCTERCDRTALSSILTAPSVSECLSISVAHLNCPVPENEADPISNVELKQAQIEDEVTGPVYQAVVLGSRPSRRECESMSRKSRVLLKQWAKLNILDGVLVRKTDKYCQMILPEKYHNIVYTELHQKMGHLSLERVEDLARRRFFWPHMSADIDYFIHHKCPCLMTKKPNMPERAPLVPIHATYPFEMISIDYLKVDMCKGGFQYILVATDHFTRFSQAYATRSNSSRAAADKLFNNFILQFGFPTRIHHDKGQEFNSKLFQQLHSLAGIKMSNTTPYHPQGDGQCERLNRTVINMLKAIPDKEKKNWKEHLPKLMFAYNSTINKTTQFSPFFLLFGRNPRLPIDDHFPTLSDGILSTQPDSDPKKFEKFAEVWKEKMDQAYDIANKNIEKSAQYNKSKYDKHAKSVELVIGDRVLVKNFKPKDSTTFANKLSSYYEESVYEVIGKHIDRPVYVIKELGVHRAKPRTLHRNYLKKVNEFAPPLTPPAPLAPVLLPPPVIPTPVSTPTSVPPTPVTPSPIPLVQPKVRLKKKKPPPKPREKPRVSCSSSSDSESDIIVTRRRKTADVVAPVDEAPNLVGGGNRVDMDLGNGNLELPELENTVVENEELELPELENVIVSDEELQLPEPEADIIVEHPAEELEMDHEIIPDHVDGLIDHDSEVENDVVLELDEEDLTMVEDSEESVHQESELDSENGDADVSEEDHEIFHSAHDDSLDMEDVPAERPLRRSGRERKPAKVFEYTKKGRPTWKSRK